MRNRGLGFRGYVNFGGGNRGNQQQGGPQQFIQNFLGSNPQELINQGLRNGAPVLVDLGFAFLDSLDGNDLAADGLESGVIGSGGRAALSTIPSALVRWSEESRVIDGDSLHDAVTGVKPQILEQGEARALFVFSLSDP